MKELTLVAGVALAAACGRSSFLVEIRDRSDADHGRRPGDVDEARLPWGNWAETFEIPACPASPYAPLVVDTLTTELDGGETLVEPTQAGPALSFVEAMWIAANRGGLSQVYFSEAVFPAGSPGVIRLSEEVRFPMTSGQACVDARARGVVLEWPLDLDVGCFSCMWHVAAGSLVVGLEMRRAPQALRCAGSQVAACLIEAPYVALEANFGNLDTLIGPGNAFVGEGTSVRLDWPGTAPVRIFDNDFGIGPAGPAPNLRQALTLFTSAVIEGNLFAVHDAVFQGSLDSDESVVLRNNLFGVDRAGRSLGSDFAGVQFVGSGPGRWVIGPANVMRGTAAGVLAVGNEGGVVTITRNSISQCGVGISFAFDVAPAPPVVLTAAAGAISGTCAMPGTVEVFSDPGDQGEVFLGDALCDGTTPWTVAVTAPAGRNVTATFTDSVGNSSGFSVPLFVP